MNINFLSFFAVAAEDTNCNSALFVCLFIDDGNKLKEFFFVAYFFETLFFNMIKDKQIEMRGNATCLHFFLTFLFGTMYVEGK